MGLEEELLRIAKKLEKMVSRKKTVRLQSLQLSPPGHRGSRNGIGGRAGRVPKGRSRDTNQEAGDRLTGRGVRELLARHLGWACA